MVNGTLEKIDREKLGFLRTVTYERDGNLHTVEWKLLKKKLISNQICLVTPDGIVLSVIRNGQL